MMIRNFEFWRIVGALAYLLSPSFCLDSINLDLEVLENIDLSALGTPNLDRFKATWNLTVDPTSCEYALSLNFYKHEEDVPGPSMFQGECSPEADTGVATDGLPWHAERRHWLQFPPYVFDTTGFNHLSVKWVPCGREPGAFKQARYDLDYYTVLPQYRAYMACQEFKTPAVCQYNQSSFVGRGMFTIPRLERDPDFLANMPLRFQPDLSNPEGWYSIISYFAFSSLLIIILLLRILLTQPFFYCFSFLPILQPSNTKV
jgi:hypothetical protein